MQHITVTALDAEGRTEIRSALRDARRGGTAVLLSGAAGSWAHKRQSGDAALAPTDFHPLLLAVIAHPAPVIVALQGAVMGFGLALAAAADVRLVSEGTSFRVGGPGVALETGSYRALVGLIGRGQADALVYSDRELDAAEAVQHGIVTAMLTDAADAEERATELSTAAAAAFKRAASARIAPQLTEALEYDAWLALIAAGESP